MIRRVTAAETVRNFSLLSDEALSRPLVLTRNGRDRLVLLNVDCFKNLISQAADGAVTTDQAAKLGEILQELARSQTVP